MGWIHQLNAQSLISILDSIESQYDVSFAYNSDKLADINWTYPSDGMSLSELLDQLSTEKKLEYKKVNNQKILLRTASRVENYAIENTIKGTLVDISTGESLPYAAIYTDDLRSGTTTNENGVFELSILNSNPTHLNFQYLGYQSKRIAIKHIKDGGTVYLAPSIKMIQPITIAEEPVKLSMMHPTRVNIDKLYFNNSVSVLSGSDPIAGLKNIAGFMAYDDLSAASGFRGSSADANMYMLDEMPLIQVDHFFGIFSSVQESMVEHINLYKNNWPAEFGGRTSALIDIQSVSRDTFSGSVAINNLTSEATINIPMGTTAKLLFAGRTTNTDISNSSFFQFLYKNGNTANPNNDRNRVLSVEPTFRFSDYYLKGDFELGESTALTLKYFGSGDNFNYNYDRIFQARKDSLRFPINESYNEVSYWDNSAWGLSLVHQWTPFFTSNWNANHSSYRFEEEIDILLSNPLKPIRGFKVPIKNSFSNVVTQSQLQWNNELTLPNNTLFKFGYQFNDIEAKVGLEQDTENLINSQLNTMQHTVFAALNNGEHTKFAWTLAGRATYDSRSKEMLYSPRIQASYFINNQTQIKSSIAYYEQTIRQTYYEDRFNRGRSFWIISNENIPNLSTLNNMIGLSYSKNGLGIDAELYYKQSYGITEFALALPAIASGDQSGNLPKPELSLFTGDGQSFGLDLTLSLELDKLESQLAYTLSKSEQIIPELNRGIAYASQDDRRHQVKWLNTLQLGNWSFYANIIFASGKPYLDLTTGEFLNTNRRNIPFDRFIKRLNAYERLDLGIDYEFKLMKEVNGTLGASVFNVLNHDNEAYRQNVYAIHGTKQSAVFGNSIQMLGITPSLQFKLTF